MRLIKLFFVAVLLVSCTPNPAMLNNSKAEQSGGQTGYPATITENKSSQSYPAPLQTGESNKSMPTQTANPMLGTVKGKLFEKGKAVPDVDLYLSTSIKNGEGTEIAAGIDRATSPRAKTDANGAFQFINVPAGKYGLVLDLVQNSYLLLNPKTGEQMRFDVTVGKQTDLGMLDYNELPKAQ